jgi:hypothetical protein
MNPAFNSAWNTYVKDSLPLISATIGAFGGGIVSGFLVHVLTQSREREKWILDSKKQEYRELLSAMSNAYIVTLSSTFDEIYNDKDGRNRYFNAQNHSIRLFRDRIFINNDLDLESLAMRWAEVLNAKSTIERSLIHQEFDSIRDEIVNAANRAVPRTTWQRLQFWND